MFIRYNVKPAFFDKIATRTLILESFGITKNQASNKRQGFKRRKLRAWIWLKQGGKCFWCGCHTKIPVVGGCTHKPKTATLDHLLPKSHGGRILLHNIVVSCGGCNSARGNRTGVGTIKWIKNILAKPK